MDSEKTSRIIEISSYAASRESLRCSTDECVKKVIQDILDRERAFKDEQDGSTHPSYTYFRVPYHMTCRLRYTKKKEEYEQQFQHELNKMLNHQPTAYDAARFNRHVCITTLWPPLHNRKEIERFQRDFFRLSPKQRKRLEFLMNTKIN